MTPSTRVVRADDDGRRAVVELLRRGGVAVVPTDTVYGLAAQPDAADAVRSIYRLKGRPEGMHLPVLAASVAQVRALGVAFTPGADALVRRWWPGPLTLAFGFGTDLARPAWLDGRTEVAVRIPDDAFLRAVMEQAGALVVTSANPHGTPTPRTAQDVATSLGDDLELVVDGGELQDTPSTLVNVHALTPVVEREGAIARTAVEGVLAEVR